MVEEMGASFSASLFLPMGPETSYVPSLLQSLATKQDYWVYCVDSYKTKTRVFGTY